MQVVITGCGRSGTNLLLEVVRASGQFNFTEEVEDKRVFDRFIYSNYGTKIAVEWDSFTVDNLARMLDMLPDLKILFSFRHPYDTILSKVYRGQPKSKGGDNGTEEIAKDGTISKATDYVRKSWSVFYELVKLYHITRVNVFKMEDLITNTEFTVKHISAFLNIKVNAEMLEPWKFTQNKWHKKRYGQTKNLGEIDKWKDLDNNYNGYFANLDTAVFKQINLSIADQANFFNYELR